MSKIFKAFQENERTIRRIIAKYRPNPSDIEELAQETFIRAFAAELKQDIREPEKFLTRTAKNLSIQRSIRKEHQTTKSAEELAGIEVIEDADQVSQEDWLDARQRLAIFAQAIENLKPALRETLIMRRIEGLTVGNIATRLDLSVSAVEKRLANAMIDCHTYIRAKGLDPVDFGERRKARRTPKTSASTTPITHEKGADENR